MKLEWTFLRKTRGKQVDQDREEADTERKIRRQNIIIVALGLAMFVVYAVISHFFKGARFPLPSPFG